MRVKFRRATVQVLLLLGSIFLIISFSLPRPQVSSDKNDQALPLTAPAYIFNASEHVNKIYRRLNSSDEAIGMFSNLILTYMAPWMKLEVCNK